MKTKTTTVGRGGSYDRVVLGKFTCVQFDSLNELLHYRTRNPGDLLLDILNDAISTHCQNVLRTAHGDKRDTPFPVKWEVRSLLDKASLCRENLPSGVPQPELDLLL